MFFGDSIIFWLFAACFLASIGTSLILLERIRQQLNRILPADKRMNVHTPLPRSVKDLVWRTNILAHSLDLLEQHREYYPSSLLRKAYCIAVFSTIPSFIGFAISAR
jgi:hypothetical protein